MTSFSWSGIDREGKKPCPHPCVFFVLLHTTLPTSDDTTLLLHYNDSRTMTNCFRNNMSRFSTHPEHNFARSPPLSANARIVHNNAFDDWLGYTRSGDLLERR